MKFLRNSNGVWGLVLILLGVGFLLGSLKVFSFGDYMIKIWPLLLLLIALVKFSEGSYKSGLIWVVVSLVLLLSTLGLLKVGFWGVFWPVILIVVGLNFLLGPSWDAGSTSNEHFNLMGVFGGSVKTTNSKKFSGANMLSIFGGSSLDLRKATLSDKGAVISVLTVFGGTELFVPDNMPVKMDVFALFGGSEDKRKLVEASEKQPTLLIQGIALFGGVEIKS